MKLEKLKDNDREEANCNNFQICAPSVCRSILRRKKPEGSETREDHKQRYEEPMKRQDEEPQKRLTEVARTIRRRICFSAC